MPDLLGMSAGTTTVDPVRAQVEETLRRAVDTVAAVPCELARRTRERAGRMAERLTDSVTTSISLARTLGELTFGGLLGVGRSAVVPVSGVRPPSALPERRPTVVSTPTGLTERADTNADDLPLEDYESLAASQVVARLARLSPGDLVKIREFEEANRGRRTILGKIEQLLDT
jgi:hypothetical protein